MHTDGVRPLGNGLLAIYLGAHEALPGEVIDGPNLDNRGSPRSVTLAPTTTQVIALPLNLTYDALRLVDVNRDGHLDLVLTERPPSSQPYPHRFTLLLGLGDGTFAVDHPQAWEGHCDRISRDCRIFANLDGEGSSSVILWSPLEELEVQDGILVGGTRYIGAPI